MEKEYRIFDVQDKDLFVAIESHYSKRTDAKQVYIESKISKEKNDDSLIITIAKNDYAEIHSVVTFGVEEGERFALALFNLCQSIKY